MESNHRTFRVKKNFKTTQVHDVIIIINKNIHDYIIFMHNYINLRYFDFIMEFCKYIYKKIILANKN